MSSRIDDTQSAPTPLRTPIQTTLMYAGEHESLPKRATPVRDFVVSRSNERGRSWTLTRDGRFAASFATYEDALDVAKHWGGQAFARDRTHEVRVMVEWMRGRLEVEAHFVPASASVFARSA
ncbi:MAG TPA: hypothetical protein VND91_09735 [Candidatus Saccharimonadia bacterium]|nr:hypothetical protein [Candidatus Saccharimonadia bacterium]